MHSHSSLLVLSLVAFCTLQTTLASSSSPNASVTPTPEDEIAYLLNKYSRAHSYHDSYSFDARDGWQTANASDLSYKYNSSSSDHKRALYDHGDAVDRRRSRHGTRGKKGSNNDAKKNSKTPKKTSALGVLTHTLDQVWKGIKGIGKQEKVIITWYSGHDLLNPSCWSNSKWAPTDNTFACALTLEGWTDRPKCFSFLEICNGPKKCIFVRVVDSCAGCKKGSRHVDLTKISFSQLASLDVGLLNVQMRLATEPPTWLEQLWGPKQN